MNNETLSLSENSHKTTCGEAAMAGDDTLSHPSTTNNNAHCPKLVMPFAVKSLPPIFHVPLLDPLSWSYCGNCLCCAL